MAQQTDHIGEVNKMVDNHIGETNKTMTAVEWLENKLPKGFYTKIFEQAKEMEKEQMINLVEQWEKRKNESNLDNIEYLYNETYNK